MVKFLHSLTNSHLVNGNARLPESCSLRLRHRFEEESLPTVRFEADSLERLVPSLVLVEQCLTCAWFYSLKDMGLGKTVQTMALILANPPEGQKGYPFIQSRNKTNAFRCTLVVCPVSVIANWTLQLDKFVSKEARLKVVTYHGPKRDEVLETVFDNKIDVLLTSFDTLASDYKKCEEKEEAQKEVGGTVLNGSALNASMMVETKSKSQATSKRITDIATPTPRKARRKRVRYSANDENESSGGTEHADAPSDSDEETISDDDSNVLDDSHVLNESAYILDESNILDESAFTYVDDECSDLLSEGDLETIFDVGFHRVVVSLAYR
jgi:hypothetical protein